MSNTVKKDKATTEVTAVKEPKLPNRKRIGESESLLTE